MFKMLKAASTKYVLPLFGHIMWCSILYGGGHAFPGNEYKSMSCPQK